MCPRPAWTVVKNFWSTPPSPHQCSPELFSGAAASQEPLKTSSRWRDCCRLPSSWPRLVLSTLLSLTPMLFREDKSWNLFFFFPFP